MIIIRFNDRENFSEAFRNTKFHNSFIFWSCVWCLYYKNPSCQSKVFITHINFFVYIRVMIHWVSFDLLYKCIISRLSYFGKSLGKDDTLLMCFLCCINVMLWNPTILYVLRLASCMCCGQRVIGYLCCIDV